MALVDNTSVWGKIEGMTAPMEKAVKMTTKLESMKKELEEVEAKIVEWSNESVRIQREHTERYNLGVRNTHEEAVKIMDAQTMRENERSNLLSKKESLCNRIRIREEAMDLLKEAGILNERGREVSQMPQTAILIVVASILYHVFNANSCRKIEEYPLQNSQQLPW